MTYFRTVTKYKPNYSSVKLYDYGRHYFFLLLNCPYEARGAKYKDRLKFQRFYSLKIVEYFRIVTKYNAKLFEYYKHLWFFVAYAPDTGYGCCLLPSMAMCRPNRPCIL